MEEKVFRKHLSNKRPLFFMIADFHIETEHYKIIQYKEREYFALNCVFYEDNHKINQSVNGQLLLTLKGIKALIKEYEVYDYEQSDPHFYGYYNKYKLPVIRHISRQGGDDFVKDYQKYKYEVKRK